MGETIQELDSREVVTDGLTETTQQEASDNKPPSLGPESTPAEPVKQASVRGASGPRSQAGKKRSSRNALKHGIFAYAMVLQGESRKQYVSFLEDLREGFKPQNAAEELLVEKLAVTAWRHRRVVIAESAAIEKTAALKRFDRLARKQDEADGLDRAILLREFGIRAEIRNPIALKCCLDLLADLRKEIDRNGFNDERDLHILQSIYASGDWHDLGHNLKNVYEKGFNKDVRPQEDDPLVAECKEAFLHEIDREMRKLKLAAKRARLEDPDRPSAEALEHVVLSPEILDTLMRYEITLDRSFERTLAQLIRLQEMRRGQPVPPPHTGEPSERQLLLTEKR